MIVPIADYTFVAAAKTITFSGAYTGLELANIKLITNVENTENVVIYQFNKLGKGGSLAGLTLTLDYNTTAMADSDNLMIIVEADFLVPPISGSVAVSNFPAVQPVSDNASSLTVDATNLDIRDLVFATDKVDISGSTVIIQEPLSIDDNGGSITVDGPLTDTELRATPVPVSGTVTATPSGTQDVNVVSLLNEGQQTMANSISVAIASDQTPVPISGSVNASVAGIYKEDDPSPGEEDGILILGIRNDLNATLTDTDFDYSGIAVDEKGAVKITNGSASLLVIDDNSVAALGHLSDIKTAVQVIDNAIAGSEMQVDVLTLPSIPAGTNNIGDVDVLSLPAIPAGTNNIGDVDVLTLPSIPAGTNNIGDVDVLTLPLRTAKFAIGSTTVMTVTNLQSKASSATAGWQSDRVSNLSTLAGDYEIFVKLTTANTAPANDKAMYVFAVPWYTTDAGTTWFCASQGTTTLPTGTEGNTTIASPHNLRLLGVLNYTTQQMVVQDIFLLSNAFGRRLPDGFSIIIINFSGAALSTGCVVDYTPIHDTLV